MARRRHRQRPSDSQQLSPAQAYQQFRQQQAFDRSEFGQFCAELPFEPDDFQVDACQQLEQGQSVLVAAPTGAGKTLVGEFAIYLSMNAGGRSFYTTPIKALSNQKYHDLCDYWGEENVGLLTGDNSINPDAPIVVMTTEVLRNMIYADSMKLSGLTHVVMDEVHYLADRFRGPAWEEIIIHLPEHVDLVCLSATVSNAEEFGSWLKEVRGQCHVTVSEQRPVPLRQHMIVAGKMMDLYRPGKKQAINPQLAAQIGKGERHYKSGRVDYRALRTRRSTVIDLLEDHDYLPAIVFVFSRAGCDKLVQQLVYDGLVLTTPEEQDIIQQAADEHLRVIPAADWSVLGIYRWVEALTKGIASHHAGLLPVQKELVEHLFKAGLVKVVAATETLALGINMPARSVVLESLRKFNGSEHVRLTPGQYTQLTGRAGRRGIDTMGHAVVVYNRGNEPTVVAALASKRSYPLNSAFKPTYNMVTNLLTKLSMEQARHVLERSFAQYQADAKVVTLARKADKAQRKAEQLEVTCDRGDINEYLKLVVEVEQQQGHSYQQIQRAYKRYLNSFFPRLKRGHVIAYHAKRRIRYGLVVEETSARFPRQVIVVNEDARVRTIHADDVEDGIDRVGFIDVGSYHYRKPRDRARLASQLRHAVRDEEFPRPDFTVALDDDDRDYRAAVEKMEQHPVHSCPHRKKHIYDSKAWRRNQKKLNTLLEKIESSTSTLGRQFDVVCRVLESFDCLDDGTVTDVGQTLTRIYSERDLLIALTVSRGLLDECSPAGLAAVVAALVNDPSDSLSHMVSDDNVNETLTQVHGLWAELTDRETRFGAPQTPPLNTNYPAAMWLWAHGSELNDVIDYADVAPGDFVRAANQIIDMLVQITHVVERDSPLFTRLHQARHLIDRGVVEWSNI